MIAWHVEAEGRRGRIFAASDSRITKESLREAFTREVEEEDRSRMPLLARILEQPLVRGTAHPGTSPRDVHHVYLDGGEAGPVFACVIVPEDRLTAMLDRAPFVVEGLSLQVSAGRHITRDAVRAALEAWADRNFPAVPLPAFDIRPWLDPEATGDPGDLPPEAAALDEELPREWNPGTPVQEPWMGEAG